ncbi:MAG TPA: ERV1/ALR-related protein [Nitrosarchaeum sp.]|nr:ERV1/ALR-related protein [Nitrosarchaeum sp.]
MANKDGDSSWGRPIWKSMHIFAACVDEQNVREFFDYLHLLPKLIPCKKCGGHFAQLLKMFPPESQITNKHDAVLYTYFLQDQVNISINREKTKPLKKSPNFEDFKTELFASLETHCKECKLVMQTL